MPDRQDAHDSLPHPDVLQTLIEYLHRATFPDARLHSFLEGLLQALREQWPDITRAEVYLRDHDDTYCRRAAVGVSEHVPKTLAPESTAAYALDRNQLVAPKPESDPAQWAIPLSSGETVFGALQVDLPADAPDSAAVGATLSALVLPLGLAVAHLYTAPVARALVLSQSLADTPALPEMVSGIAGYVGANRLPVELAIFEYDGEQSVRVRRVAVAGPDAAAPAESVIAMIDYPLGAALPSLKKGQPVQIGNVYDTPLIAATHHHTFRAQQITRLTLVPLVADGRLIGVLSVAGQPFDPHDLHGLGTLARQIAILMYNQALIEHAAGALDEAQQLHRLGDAVLRAEDDPSALVQAVYEQFSTPPDMLSLESIHLDEAGDPSILTTQAVISADGPGKSGIHTNITAHGLESFVAKLQDSTPLLVNNLKTDTALDVSAHNYFEKRKMHAISVFPIVIDGKLTHTVTAAYHAPHIYTAREIRLLHRLSEQIGQEVRNWALLQQTQEQAERLTRQVRLLEALHEISRHVSARLASSEVLQTTCQSLVETLKLNYAAIIRLDQVPSNGNLVAEHPARIGVGTLFSLVEFGAYKHLQDYRNPLQIEDMASSGDLLGPNRARFEALEVQTAIVAPLLVHGELIGMLVLASDKKSYRFSQEEMLIAQVIGTQIAISLRNAELFGEIQHRASQLERIAAFGRLVTSTFNQEEILRRVMDVIPNLLPADQVNITLYVPGQHQMRLIVLTKVADPEESTVPIAGSSVEEIVQTQMPMLVPDLQSSSYTDHRRLAQQGFSSVLTAPLAIGGRYLGTVNLAHRRPHIYSPTDLTLLQQVANQIAIALENARLFQATQQRAKYEESLSEITSRLQQPTDLRDLLQQTMQDLGQVLGARRARVRLQTDSGTNGAGASRPGK